MHFTYGIIVNLIASTLVALASEQDGIIGSTMKDGPSPRKFFVGNKRNVNAPTPIPDTQSDAVKCSWEGKKVVDPDSPHKFYLCHYYPESETWLMYPFQCNPENSVFNFRSQKCLNSSDSSVSTPLKLSTNAPVPKANTKVKSRSKDKRVNKNQKTRTEPQPGDKLITDQSNAIVSLANSVRSLANTVDKLVKINFRSHYGFAQPVFLKSSNKKKKQGQKKPNKKNQQKPSEKQNESLMPKVSIPSHTQFRLPPPPKRFIGPIRKQTPNIKPGINIVRPPMLFINPFDQGFDSSTEAQPFIRPTKPFQIIRRPYGQNKVRPFSIFKNFLNDVMHFPIPMSVHLSTKPITPGNSLNFKNKNVSSLTTKQPESKDKTTEGPSPDSSTPQVAKSDTPEILKVDNDYNPGDEFINIFSFLNKLNDAGEDSITSPMMDLTYEIASPEVEDSQKNRNDEVISEETSSPIAEVEANSTTTSPTTELTPTPAVSVTEQILQAKSSKAVSDFPVVSSDDHQHPHTFRLNTNRKPRPGF